MASERCTAAVAAVPTAVAAAAPSPIHVAVDRRVALDGGADHRLGAFLGTHVGSGGQGAFAEFARQRRASAN